MFPRVTGIKLLIRKVSQFRFVIFDGMIWSDYHKTFIDELALCGKIYEGVLKDKTEAKEEPFLCMETIHNPIMDKFDKQIDSNRLEFDWCLRFYFEKKVDLLTEPYVEKPRLSLFVNFLYNLYLINKDL
jgi:hypothetical protein